MIKNVIFDWTGVINDNLKASAFSINFIFQHFGIKELSWEEMKKEWIQPYPLFYKKFIPHVSIEKEQELYKLAYPIAKEKFPSQAFPGMVELLKKFKEAKIKMIIISSDHPEHLFEEVEDYGLNGIFDELYTDVIDKQKGLQEIMIKHDFHKNDTIFIGDTHHEIDAGRSVGMMTGSVTWGFQNEGRLLEAKPDFIFKKP